MSAGSKMSSIETQSITTSFDNQPVPLGIYWHEGMLLSQHLFQQNDLRYFQILSRQLALVSNYHWGVVELDIDKNALSSGIYRINSIEAVFPDSLLLQYSIKSEYNIRPLELNINNIIENEFTVYLVIAYLDSQVSRLSGDNPRFYSIEGVAVKDENLVGNETIVPRLVPNAFLQLNSVPEGCVGLPISRISHVDDNFTILDWTPPCFYITKQSIIWKQCSELIQLLKNRLEVLITRTSSSDGAALLDIRQLLAQLAMVVYPLEALIFGESTKPYGLYIELLRLLGAVAIFNPNQNLSIPKYNHNDLDNCILPIVEKVSKCLAIIDCGYIVVPFDRREYFFYKYMSRQDFDSVHDNKLFIGIRCNNIANFKDIITWMKDAVIVSDFALDAVRLKRIQGAMRRELSADAVTKILPGSNVMLFEVEIDSHYIKPEQNLHVFNPGVSRDLQPKDVLLYLPRLGAM